MATDVIAQEPDEGGEHRLPARAEEHGGFFHIYKKGQGYWTRVGSAAAAGLIVLLTLQFLFTHLNVWVYPAFRPATETPDSIAHAQSMTKITALSVCGGFLLGAFLLVFWALNKPNYADFLIATDSEMKKVNWTSRKELMGSTKVVIGFMFLIAFLLFAFDIFFGYLFYFMHVLKTPPL